jgi:phosphatidate cytidylyltransferase
MEDADATPPPGRKRDRFKERVRRYTQVPFAVRTGDLPKRLASAAVMLLVAAAAFVAGGIWLRGFIVLVALVCFAEFARLVWRATSSAALRLIGLAAGVLYIGAAAAVLEGAGQFLLILLIGVTVFTDTGAYFAGRAIGGPKIAPAISPSKTWAGLAGGMIASALWVVLWAVYLNDPVDGIGPRFELGLDLGAGNVLLLVAIGAGLAVVAQAGDFFESWLKRKAGVKDSSRLIPGHGGIFDRVDGLLPVALVVGFVSGALMS